MGAGLALGAAPSALVQLVEPEPVRRYWQVPAGAPVGGTGELFGIEAYGGTWQAALYRRYNAIIQPLSREALQESLGRMREQPPIPVHLIAPETYDMWARAVRS